MVKVISRQLVANCETAERKAGARVVEKYHA